MMKRQEGFTLIELVVVIVILGILAVTAAPRFLNLQDDAREASLEGLRGAVAGAMGISYGRAAIEGIEAKDYEAYVDTNTTGTVIDDIAHIYGYPAAASNGVDYLGGILQTIDSSEDFVVLHSTSGDETDLTNTTIDIGLDGFTDKCVRYTAAVSDTEPATVELVEGVSGGACGK